MIVPKRGSTNRSALYIQLHLKQRASSRWTLNSFGPKWSCASDCLISEITVLLSWEFCGSTSIFNALNLGFDLALWNVEQHVYVIARLWQYCKIAYSLCTGFQKILFRKILATVICFPSFIASGKPSRSDSSSEKIGKMERFIRRYSMMKTATFIT